ncbi:MAG: TIGR04211 family SH3 domain-containing protein [Luminiphilus sp.]|jgi:SH3 domain protein|nr:TIGR04211 family SH3 domain-containing protein [Luminiphilus sp.]MDG2037653.1 TIGR04211 family SH3 domain-containing protein [Luminiphilus sp.]
MRLRSANTVCSLRVLFLPVVLMAHSIGMAQETQYVSDKVLVPVRSGAGADYRIVNRGLPSGTALLVFAESDDGEWAEIETRGGTRGWIPSQYLQQEPPAALLINDLRVELEQARAERDRVVSQLNQSSTEVDEADETIIGLTTTIERTQAELTEIKRVSAAALDLDLMNQQLVAELESGRSSADLLRLENVRLRERIANNQMMDGALAVLLGVILAVVAPRLWPRKKRPDGWS